MTTGTRAHRAFALIVAVLGLIAPLAPERAAAMIAIAITSDATPLPGTPPFPRGKAQYGSVVTFTITASGNSYDDFVVTISCPNTALDVGREDG